MRWVQEAKNELHDICRIWCEDRARSIGECGDQIDLHEADNVQNNLTIVPAESKPIIDDFQENRDADSELILGCREWVIWERKPVVGTGNKYGNEGT